MYKSTKIFFLNCLANWDLEIFLSKFEVVVGRVGSKITPEPKMQGLRKLFVKVWGGGGGGQKSHLNQKYRKFHEMDKSTKKIFFHSLANLDLENFLFKVWGGGEGGLSKITPEPKMQEISWNG